MEDFNPRCAGTTHLLLLQSAKWTPVVAKRKVDARNQRNVLGCIVHYYLHLFTPTNESTALVHVGERHIKLSLNVVKYI